MRILVVLQLCLFLTFLACPGFGQKDIGVVKLPSRVHRKALLIGNNAYGSPLINCERDVDSMEVVLRKVNFSVVAWKNLPRIHMIATIDKFVAGLNESDTVVFYYSGHGVGMNNDSYLLATDVQLCDITDESLYKPLILSTILNRILARNVKNAFFFLDACRNYYAELKNCTTGPGITNGLKMPSHPTIGFLVAFATDENNTADDSYIDPANSLFTAELIKHLATPGIGVREALDKVKAGVLTRSGGRQNPQRSDELFRDVTFLKGDGTNDKTRNMPSDIPCDPVVYSSDREHYRAIGEGLSPQRGLALEIAQSSAIAAMGRAIHTSLRSATLRYLSQTNTNNGNILQDTTRIMQTMMADMEIKNSRTVCSKCQTLQPGNTYSCWAAVEVSVDDVVVRLEKQLANRKNKKPFTGNGSFTRTFREEWDRIYSQLTLSK